MIRALGFSSTWFDPNHPGRLCRGRERWVLGWEGEEPPPLHRLVITGAAFSDDSARDARRGLDLSGVDPGELVRAIFPKQALLAFAEEGAAGDLPEGVDDEDAFKAPRRGGRWFEPVVRWRRPVETAAEVSELVRTERADGFAVGEAKEGLDDALFLLTSMGDGSSWPVRRFQPLAIAGVLEHCDALVCVHLDKHGPALGVYTHDPLDVEDTLRSLAEKAGALCVPFSIPPMLARWDRALQEHRLWWMRNRDDEFPVPPADEPTRWSRHGRPAAQAAPQTAAGEE